MNQNKLLNGYQQMQQVSIPFQNNVLLQNNPIFNSNGNIHNTTANLNYNNSMQAQQMQQAQMQQLQLQQMQIQQMQMQQMQKMKEMQQIKQLEKLNELENTVDKDKIKESVIRPIKIERSIKDKKELESKWNEAEKKYYKDKDNKKDKGFGPEITGYWKERSNMPYKGILKNEDYTKKVASGNDLIVHKISIKDKEGVTEGLTEFKKNIEKHDDELKVIYSTSKINEHKKKFEYNHKYKYRYDPKDHGDLKKDGVKYYKEQQKKEEDGKEKLDVMNTIMDSLINDGIFDKDELNSVKISKKPVSDTDSNSSGSGSVVKKNNISIKSVDNTKQEKREKYLNRKK